MIQILSSFGMHRNKVLFIGTDAIDIVAFAMNGWLLGRSASGTNAGLTLSFTGTYISATSSGVYSGTASVTARVACHVTGYYVNSGSENIYSVDSNFAAGATVLSNKNYFLLIAY